MNGWMSACLGDRWMDEMEEWMDGWMDDEWMDDGWMDDERVDG